MKRLVILGAGTAGTIVANRLRRRLGLRHWRITVVDHDNAHLYQPGLLFVPFGEGKPDELVRPRQRSLATGIEFVDGEVDRVDPAARAVDLADGRTISYDYLVIASGTQPRPDQTPGLLGAEWRRSMPTCQQRCP